MTQQANLQKLPEKKNDDPPLRKIMDFSQTISLATSHRIRLSDGRHLSYIEKGVPKQESNYTVIIVHGFASSKNMQFTASKDLIDELGVHFLLYDRAGYGESDPNPTRTVKSEAYDIQELADQLDIGSKFYLIGVSMGSYPTWGCIKYISHRLAGVAMVVPIINYRWPSVANKINGMDFRIRFVQCAVWMAEHAPKLLYWWLSKIWLPSSSSSSVQSNSMFFSNGDLDVVKSTSRFQMLTQTKIKEKGVFESMRRDFLVGFEKWDFDPLDLENPFPRNKTCTHIWQGSEDKIVPVELQRYVSAKLPWIQYHEVPNAGHFIVHDTKLCDAIVNALLYTKKT